MIKKYQYFFWRLAYVAIKPSAVMFSACFLTESVANLLALAILLSSTLMASLSFGTYKNIFVYSKGKRNIYFEMHRRAMFLANVVLLCLFCVFFWYFFKISGANITFIFLFIITEHIIHDEVRVILYSGNRSQWAKQNFIRSTFILAIPLTAIFLNNESLMVYLLLIFTIGNCVYSYSQKGLCSNLVSASSILFRRKFSKYYCRQSNYFLSSTASKFAQQSDRYLFTLINYSELWIYSIVVQVATISLMAFEVTHISKFKSKIAKQQVLRFSTLNGPQLSQLLVVNLVCASFYFILGYYITELLSSKYVFLFSVLLIFNFLGAINMLNSERLFWHLHNPKRFMEIEFKSLIVGHLLLVPLIYIFNLLLLVKLPTYITFITKIVSAKKCLKN